MAKGVALDNRKLVLAINRLLARIRSLTGPDAHLPAVVFVVVYAFLLLCIPSQLIVRPIGSPGTPANLWGIAALLWWICSTLGGLNPVRGFTATRVSLGLVALAVLISYVAGNIHGWYAPADIHQVTDEFWTLLQIQPGDVNEKMISAADRGLLTFAGWSGILLLSSEGLRSWRDMELLVKWLVRFGAFVALLGVIQFFTAFDIAALFQIPGLSPNSEFGAVQTRSVLNRVSSTAVHPIEFGVVMAGLFWLAMHRSLFSKSLMAWIPTLLIGIALPMSVSRSAILALGVSAIIVMVGWPNRWRIWAVVALPFVVFGMRLLAPGLVGTIRSLFSNISNDPSISGRTDDYTAVFAVYQDSPLVGRGLFTFVPRYYRILDNQILMTLIELGAIGLAAVVIMILTGFLLARAAMRRSANPAQRNLALAISAGLVGVVLSYFTFDAWGFPMVAGLTFLLLGLAGAAGRISREGADTVPAEPVVRGAKVVRR